MSVKFVLKYDDFTHENKLKMNNVIRNGLTWNNPLSYAESLNCMISEISRHIKVHQELSLTQLLQQNVIGVEQYFFRIVNSCEYLSDSLSKTYRFHKYPGKRPMDMHSYDYWFVPVC